MRYSEEASRFLGLLDDEQRVVATAPMGDDGVRRDWHYIPRARRGLCLADMSAIQQKSAIELLATGMSAAAYSTACLVMALEDVLDLQEAGAGPRRGAQRPWGRHRAEYHVIVFGSPADSAWGWRFEGHHLSVTVTVVDGEISCTPMFLGANPMAVEGSHRLFAAEQRLAFDALEAMDGDEREVAVASDVAPDDILTTNAAHLRDVLPPDAGVLVGDLSAEPRRIVRELVAHYDARLHSSRTLGDPDRMRFTFSGTLAPADPHYYRLQGRTSLVEYDCTQDGANHVHTVVRDVDADFGDDLLRRHLAAAH